MISQLVSWFGALLGGLDGLRQFAFAQMKQLRADALVCQVPDLQFDGFQIIRNLHRMGAMYAGVLTFDQGFSIISAIRELAVDSIELLPSKLSWCNLTIFDVGHIPNHASARARRQATGRIEPRAKRQKQSEKCFA
jgi:hypothetical protein